MSYAHGQKKRKSSLRDDRGIETQRALRSHWNNREHGNSKLVLQMRKTYPKIIAICALTVFNIAIPVLAEFKEYLL
jgi:hypothetical protein